MRPFAAVLAAGILTLPSTALAWGYEGHEIVAGIARAYLTGPARAKIDAILQADDDDLTRHDMASEATWADAYRGAGHRETAQWHFVDQEIDGSADLGSACFGHPAAGKLASSGPAQDCIVDKIDEFAAELAAPETKPQERIVALKFLLHFVGDMHQPLHASDNHDRGGNCVPITLGGTRTVNLHSYWDTGVVERLGRDPQRVAAALVGRITPAQAAEWRRGTTADWARETFGVARAAAYTIGSLAGCQSDVAPRELPPGYETAAEAAAALQLERGGVRLAAILNRALANVAVSPAVQQDGARGGATSSTAGGSSSNTRTPTSMACSAEADRRGLHGGDRQRFRRRCMRDSSPN